MGKAETAQGPNVALTGEAEAKGYAGIRRSKPSTEKVSVSI